MARPLRLDVSGGFYHVMSRGNERSNIFIDDEDRRRFFKIFLSSTERYAVRCHTFCLMGNHYHLLLETPDGNISEAIRHLNGVYAQWFNNRHNRVGHLFQGRFKSILIDVDTYLLAVARYIVQNPVRASLVTHPSDWKWSSYGALAGLTLPPSFLTTGFLLHSFDTSDLKRARERYCQFIDEDHDHDKKIQAEGPILGSTEFIETFRDELADSATLREFSRAERFIAKRSLKDIFHCYSDRQMRNSLIYEAHIHYGYTMTEIAKHLGLHIMTISRVVRKKEMLKC